MQPDATTDEDPADPSDIIAATKPADNQMLKSDGRPICVVAPMPRIPEPAEPVSGAYDDDDTTLVAVVPRKSSPTNSSVRPHLSSWIMMVRFILGKEQVLCPVTCKEIESFE